MDIYVDHNTIDISNIVNIQKYLKETTSYKIILKPIKQVFIVLLSFSGSLPTIYITRNNEQFLARPNLIDLSSNEQIIIHLWLV